MHPAYAADLSKAGNADEATQQYRTLLDDPSSPRDENGVAYRFYAAERLLHAKLDLLGRLRLWEPVRLNPFCRKPCAESGSAIIDPLGVARQRARQAASQKYDPAAHLQKSNTGFTYEKQGP